MRRIALHAFRVLQFCNACLVVLTANVGVKREFLHSAIATLLVYYIH